ncbi:metallophosphoesterase family protein [Gloeothece verrucosa]|uniref:Alkaline phosphatase n=1 Tax=Gloeothece verrucosa (strain PCC 7822) TaxID=497965 RepID=E0U944_GLOV7|nr:metallophosphoesterase [Gloeothece verrucosa]ADN17302.1 Alkaline phosphatase [Gloeothece verrucosa PCC 7822]
MNKVLKILILASISLLSVIYIGLMQFQAVKTAEVKEIEIKLTQSNGHPIIAAAGDIACSPTSLYYRDGNGTSNNCHQKATSDILLKAKLTAVLPLGDTQYETGAFSAFEKSYAPSWGRVKNISHPVVGNHEYVTAGANGYYKYFGVAAGDSSKGYYSYDLGQWHMIALNANCSQVGGCESGSPQEKWLKADLAAHKNLCSLAYWHQPRFSSGEHGNDSSYKAFWQDLYAAGVEVILNGHDHNYERFAPQSPNGQPDASRGIREFVVGTGGKNLYHFRNIQPNSEVRNNDTYGVLMLSLEPKSYSWQFIPEAGKTFTDSGSTPCH